MKPVRILRAGLLAAALACAGTLQAQSLTLSPPVEFYFDADAGTAEKIVAIERGDVLAELAQVVERDPRALEETAQLAHLAMAGGREDLGRTLYERVLGRLSPTRSLWRPVQWNYAWDQFRAGNGEAALRRWTELVQSRSINAGWMPPTLALALWTVGRREEAVAWYAAAVRTEPTRWTAPDLEALLPGWRKDERAALAEVHAAWQAAPPAWP
jgi:tetratricopeptide (TPR) repeat protein